MNPDFLNSQSREDFFKARNKALFNEIQHFITPEETNLLSFNDMKNMLKPKNEVYLGMQTVPVSLIVGSEGRYKDFDNHFLPKSRFLQARWESIDKAHLTDVVLPPISLYELGGIYFVRDGNHRVSVAKAKGVMDIDAEVVSLKSEIHFKAGMTQKQMLKQIIQYEKRIFYAETNFGDITDCWDIDFSTPGQYDVLYNHIQIHKYYINQNKTDEISMEEAVRSFYTTVYLPVIQTIKKQHIIRRFKNRTPSDLYVWIIKYWDELKKKYGNDFSLDKAASEFTEQFSENRFFRFFQRLKKLLKLDG